MNRNTRLLVLLFVSVVMLSVFPARGHAFVGSMLRSVSREVAEICGRKGVQEGAEELGRVCLEKGGKVIKGCGRAGIRAVELAGDDAVRVAARYGREGVEMLARHSADEARFLARHADDAVAVWRRFGNEGTRLLVKHPGLARPLLENCGRRGLQVAERLSGNNLARFNWVSKRITREELDSLISWVLKKGDDVMEFLWRHKVKLVAAGGLYTLLKNYEQGFQITTLDDQDKPVRKVTTHSFIQHWIGLVTDRTLRKYPWLPLAGFGMLFLWLFPWLNRLWHLPRHRTREK